MTDPIAIAKLFCEPVKAIISALQQAYAPYSYEAQQEKLKELKGKLKEAKDMLKKLEEQANGTAVLNNDAIKWKRYAEDTLRKVESNMKCLETSIEATCTTGCLPNCCRSPGVKRSIREEVEKIDDLTEKYRPVVKGNKCPNNEFVQRTRGDDIGKIWECISQRDNVKVICIHGIAGVGKTAVAHAVCNKALLDENERFGYVIWVDADTEMALSFLQEKIMRFFSIELDNTGDDNDRARTISDELVRRKKCLIIMDSVWKNYTLREIGIPAEETEAEGIVCKVILISRSPLTCPTIPKNEFFEIKPLTESWECFEITLGRDLSGLEDEAKDLVEKAVVGCEGLPAEIIKLANYVRGIMQGHSSSEMALSLKEMLGSRTGSASPTDTQFKRLEYSYNRLENTTHQQCFLYCALYPKGSPIEVEQLIDNWICEGLLGKFNGPLEAKRKQGRNVLTVLKNARLLEKVESFGTQEAVKMLSFLHDMAVHIIVKEKKQVYINSGNDVTVFPSLDDEHGPIQRASLVHNNLGILKKNQANCPTLSTLFLQNNPLHLFSDNFFTGVPNLKLLDLSYSFISSLPSSIRSLNFLQVLRLRHCPNLRSLPSLSKLMELIVLDLFGTPLQVLPLGMDRLKKLERLDLSHNKFSEFPAGLVGSLENLQELLLFVNDIEPYRSKSNSGKACVKELSHLDGLRILQLNFLNQEVFDEYMKIVPRTMPRPHTPRFKFCVGGFNTDGKLAENSVAFIDEYPVKPQLPDGTFELYLSKCSSLSPINTLEKTGIDFQKLKVLNLYGCSGLTHLFTFEMLQCLQNIERVCVRKCRSISGIIKPAENSGTKSHLASSCHLHKLQELVLIDLPKLESICPEQQILEWPVFRRFSVWDCHRLKKLPLLVSKVGENPKKIKLRGKSFRFDDSQHLAQYEREEADVPKGTVSFVSTRKEKSNPQPVPSDDVKKNSKNQAVKKPQPPQSLGCVLSSLYDALNLDNLKKTPPQSLGSIVSSIYDVLDLEILKKKRGSATQQGVFGPPPNAGEVKAKAVENMRTSF